MTADDAQRRRNVASATRWRAVFLLLAVVVPAALFALFRRQELRLRALADHGEPATATITHVTRLGSSENSHYAYRVGGAEYTWNVRRSEAPFPPGVSFPITILPEDPSLSRPLAPYTLGHFHAERSVGVTRGFPIGAFVFFGGAAVLCHVGVTRLRRGEPLRASPRISPDTLGRVLAVLFLAVTLLTGFDPKVRAVQTALMGPAPLGVPAVVWASIVQAVLFAPYFWVLPHLMRIVVSAQAKGGGFSRLGVIVAVATAPAEHRRSRAIVVAGFVYLVAVLGAWIAFASSRGV